MFTVSFPAQKSVRLTTTLSLVGVLVALGACSNIDALRSPVFTGSTNNQRQILSGDPSPLGNTYVGQQTAAVQGADLPPPGGGQGGYGGGAGYQNYTPAPAYAQTPSYGQSSYGQAQAYSPPAGGAGPQPYIPPQSYADADAAAPAPTRLASAEAHPMHLGAPPTTLNAEAERIAPRTPRGGTSTHLVQSGDTAWNIAQRYGISVNELAAANGGSTNVRLGQRLVIPGGHGGTEPGVQLASLNPTDIPSTPHVLPVPQVPVAAATPSPQPMAPQPMAAPAAAASQAPAPAGQQLALAPQTGNAGSLAPVAPQAAADDASGFRWPVRGRVISAFGKKANGERNDGINLAVPEGTSVKAAEDGTVIYAGSELKSYGNLVLIRHANGWVSAYAHNSKLEVKRGDTVRRGEVIALSGMTGGVTTPQVHFELRKDATPVDPLQHLTES